MPLGRSTMSIAATIASHSTRLRQGFHQRSCTTTTAHHPAITSTNPPTATTSEQHPPYHHHRTNHITSNAATRSSRRPPSTLRPRRPAALPLAEAGSPDVEQITMLYRAL